MRAFVGADRDRGRAAHQRFVICGGEGLFDQHDAKIGRRLRNGGEICGQEPLIGIDNQARIGTRQMHRLDALQVFRAAQFELQQAPLCCLCGFSHDLWRSESHGHSRLDRFGFRQARELPDRRAAHLRFKVPQCAVQRAARGACRHLVLQRDTRHPVFHGAAHRLDGSRHVLDRFAVARIGNTFAPPGRAVLLKPDAEGHGLGFRPPGNGKSRPQRR